MSERASCSGTHATLSLTSHETLPLVIPLFFVNCIGRLHAVPQSCKRCLLGLAQVLGCSLCSLAEMVDPRSYRRRRRHADCSCLSTVLSISILGVTTTSLW